MARKSRVICFLGTDGAGKSTIIRELAQDLKGSDLTCHVEYFGWKPYLPTTKLISWILGKKRINIVEKMNEKSKDGKKTKEDKHHKIDLLQELLIGYYFIEYLSRYLIKIWPKKFKYQAILVDRYFYDFYAHYDYAPKSGLFRLLLRIFPRPNYLFLLIIDEKTAFLRKGEMNPHILKEHKRKYFELAKIINPNIIDTSKDIKTSLSEIKGTMFSLKKLIKMKNQKK